MGKETESDRAAPHTWSHATLLLLLLLLLRMFLVQP